MIKDRMALMAPWECGSCGARYKAELSRCQRCHSTDLRTEGNVMPKISRDNALVTMEGNPELQPRNVRGEGGEPSSVGTSSLTSSESPSPSAEPNSHDQSLPAQTTESQLPADQTELDTADSVAGETSEEPRPRSSRRRSGF